MSDIDVIQEALIERLKAGFPALPLYERHSVEYEEPYLALHVNAMATDFMVTLVLADAAGAYSPAALKQWLWRKDNKQHLKALGVAVSGPVVFDRDPAMQRMLAFNVALLTLPSRQPAVTPFDKPTPRQRPVRKSDPPAGIYQGRQLLAKTPEELVEQLSDARLAGFDLDEVEGQRLTNNTVVVLRCHRCATLTPQSARALLQGKAVPRCHACELNRRVVFGQSWANESALLAQFDAVISGSPFSNPRVTGLTGTAPLKIVLYCAHCAIDHSFNAAEIDADPAFFDRCRVKVSADRAADLQARFDACDTEALKAALALPGYRFLRFMPERRKVRLESFFVIGCTGCQAESTLYIKPYFAQHTAQGAPAPEDRQHRPCKTCQGLLATYAEREAQLRTLAPEYRIIEWLDRYRETYTGPKDTQSPWTHQVMVMTCDQGHEFQRTVGEVFHEHRECPRCVGPHLHLRSLLRLAEDSPDVLYQARYLYWVQFDHAASGQRFFKIGLANTATLKARYSAGALKSDGLTLTPLQVVRCTNLEAIVAERHILMTFAESALNMTREMQAVAGGTECFAQNVIGKRPLIEVVDEALDAGVRIGRKKLTLPFDRRRAKQLRR